MKKYWGVILTVALAVSCKQDQANFEASDDVNSLSMLENGEEPVIKYGFNLAEFNVEQDTIRNGDSFGGLMAENKVDYPKIAKVASDFKDTFDVRRMHPGKPYTILKSKDTLQAAQVFIYENDPINYTVVDFRDSVTAYTQKKKVKYVDREASGVIETSLSEAILAQGIDYNVTNNLSEIYAWTIDFFRLQKGDKFKVIYKEMFINDSIYAGALPIEAAYFEHNGRPIYAFGYQKDSLSERFDYYDEAAENLRRTFLKAPVQFSRISSRYNLNRRIAFYGNKVRAHKGTDYAAPLGTPILATADGTVTESTQKGGNGKYVKIRHNGTYSTQYLHMSRQNVKKGQYVRQGDVIGWIGMTGNTSGPHVCYRFWKNDSQIDPLREELPLAEPLDEALRPSFFTQIAPLKDKLDCMIFHEQPTESIVDLVTLNQ